MMAPLVQNFRGILNRTALCAPGHAESALLMKRDGGQAGNKIRTVRGEIDQKVSIPRLFREK